MDVIELVIVAALVNGNDIVYVDVGVNVNADVSDEAATIRRNRR